MQGHCQRVASQPRAREDVSCKLRGALVGAQDQAGTSGAHTGDLGPLGLPLASSGVVSVVWLK